MKNYLLVLIGFMLLSTTGVQAQFTLWDKLGNNVYNTNLGGGVGIGTPFPTEQLDVFGNAQVSGSFYTWGKLGVGTNNLDAKLVVSHSGSSVNTSHLWSDADMAIDFRSFSNVNSSSSDPGVFGPSDPPPYYKFYLCPSIIDEPNIISRTFYLGSSSNPWNYTFSAAFYAASSSSYLTYSDKRLKSNIKPIANAMQVISKLEAKTYDKDLNLILSPEFQGAHNVIKDEPGFIAQEMEKIIPQIVHTAEEGEEYKSIGMMGIIPYLVEALKELKAEKDQEIEEKDKKIEALTVRLEKLETAVKKL